MLDQYEDILTVEDVCEILHIGKNRVYELLETGKLQGFRIGRPWKISKEAVIFYIRTCSNLN